MTNIIQETNYLIDSFWLAHKNFPTERVVKFACDCALLNIELIKQYISSDNYELMVEFLRNPDTDYTRAAAAAADAYSYIARSTGDTAAAAAARATAYAVDTATAYTAHAYIARATAYTAAALDEDGVNKLIRELFQ